MRRRSIASSRSRSRDGSRDGMEVDKSQGSSSQQPADLNRMESEAKEKILRAKMERSKKTGNASPGA